MTFSPHLNPATEKIQLSTTGNLRLYNLQGVLLYANYGDAIDLSAYPKGIYILQIDGKTVKVAKQ